MPIYETRAPGADRPLDHVELGPGLDAAVDRRLIGDVAGRRVLVVGCGAGHDAVGLARRGARVLAVDPDPTQVEAARELAATHDLRVEFHVAGLAELAFVRADTIDVVVSVMALSTIDDLDRVLRQVHRVLRPGGHVVVSVPHPALLCRDPVDDDRTTRAWHDPAPVGGRFVHRAEDLVTAMVRADFEVDALLERPGTGGGPLPDTLVTRGEKLGI